MQPTVQESDASSNIIIPNSPFKKDDVSGRNSIHVDALDLQASGSIQGSIQSEKSNFNRFRQIMMKNQIKGTDPSTFKNENQDEEAAKKFSVDMILNNLKSNVKA